jgi:DNA-binding NtrC family response regulator
VVDDDTDVRHGLADLLRTEGYVVETARDGFKALPKLKMFLPDLLLTDLLMPGMDGLALVRKAHEIDPDAIAVVMTGHANVDSAIAAMRQGVTDYLIKPVHLEQFTRVARPELDRRRARRAATMLRAVPGDQSGIYGIIGSSREMRAVFETVLQVARSRASVLINGESGTGKELIAAAIHQHSPRAAGPFVKLHCAALVESLLESELFGHERGAFTGAAARREGRFQQADGGTLFLDEIGDVPPSTQVKLLRFLQEREFERVGGNQTIKVDVRIVAATNTDLGLHVREGRFREDLFYRLNVVSIDVPPLRARADDIPILAGHFLRLYASENDKPMRGFTAEAMEVLMHHGWPGNVRELENAIERGVVVCTGQEIGEPDLPSRVTEAFPPAREAEPRVPGATMAEVERHVIMRTLEHTGGSATRAAAILGVSPRTIQNRLRGYGAIDAARHHPSVAASDPAPDPD